MEREEKGCMLYTRGVDGEFTGRPISQEELGRIFFSEGNREWDNVHLVLPEPVWERILEDDCLLYEGFTLDHKPFGSGRVFYKNGMPRLEGVFGLKGLLCGKAYYPDGVIRFEGLFRLNQAYGPNYPEYGIWYGKDGKMLFRGKFRVSRSSLGWPSVYEPEGFGSVPDTTIKEHTFLWEDARKYIKHKGEDLHD